MKAIQFSQENGRGDWIRTNGLRLPKPSRYQTALRPADCIPISFMLNFNGSKTCFARPDDVRPFKGRMTDFRARLNTELF